MKASETVTAKRKEPDEKQEEAVEVTGKRQAENAGKNPMDLMRSSRRRHIRRPEGRLSLQDRGTGKNQDIDCETSVSGE